MKKTPYPRASGVGPKWVMLVVMLVAMLVVAEAVTMVISGTTLGRLGGVDGGGVLLKAVPSIPYFTEERQLRPIHVASR